MSETERFDSDGNNVSGSSSKVNKKNKIWIVAVIIILAYFAVNSCFIICH